MNWRVTTATLMLATALPAATAAAAPEGFRETTRLQPIAVALSPAALVYCSMSNTAWQADITVRFPSLDWTRVGGYRARGTSDVRLAPWTCRALEGWLRGKSVPTLTMLGRHALTLTHELMHTRGINDESETDCAALREMPAMLRTWFKVRNTVTLRTIMAAAWADHRSKPAAYRTVC